MIVLGLDLETTGLSPVDNRVTEIGYVLWDTQKSYPLLMESHFVGSPEVIRQNLQEIVNITGISCDILESYGSLSEDVCKKLDNFLILHNPKYIIAHNGDAFDKPFLLEEFKRSGVTEKRVDTIPWIDTRFDLPYEKNPRSMHLNHLAMDEGFINPFPHRALTDVLTMLRVMSKFDFDSILAYKTIPWVYVRALVSYDDRDKAKQQKYMWEQVGDRKFPKSWVKKLKQSYLETERKKCDFEIVEITGE